MAEEVKPKTTKPKAEKAEEKPVEDVVSETIRADENVFAPAIV